MNKQRYLDLIEQAVSAYSEEHIARYVSDTREHGILEHGYPRLVANIGVLLAHGRGMHRLAYFEDMMTLCCRELPVCRSRTRAAGNDFSVKEITLMLLALEEAAVFDRSVTDGWRALLATIDPHQTYSCISPVPPRVVGNWAAFSAASEQARIFAGLGSSRAFVHNQVLSQLLVFDENGMYRDPHEPMVYDMVTRLQLAVVLELGYDGEARAELERHMLTSAQPTLLMQSVSGEIPFGGRSNQFLHNETFYAALCEYYATVFHRRGDDETAGQFRAAARLAVDSLTPWLRGEVHHIKNRYPRDSRLGCEGYGYFDKYMVTMGSWAYLAYLFADDAIAERPCPAERGGYVWSTSPHFHKTLLTAAHYHVELDTAADFHYDANGIGRIHRAGAPTALCLSVPFPTEQPHYNIAAENPTPLAISGGILRGERWCFASAKETRWELTDHTATSDRACVRYLCTMADGTSLTLQCDVDPTGVTLTVCGEGEVGIELPLLHSDGALTSSYAMIDDTLALRYGGWLYRAVTDGQFALSYGEDGAPLTYHNRNGVYHRATTTRQGRVQLHIELLAE